MVTTVLVGCGEGAPPRGGSDRETLDNCTDGAVCISVVDLVYDPVAAWFVSGQTMSVSADAGGGGRAVPEPVLASPPQLSVGDGALGARPEPRRDLSLTDVQRSFFAGYDAAGGDPSYRAHLVSVIECESHWNLYEPSSYQSMAQFSDDSWATAGGGDPQDPYTVGRNVAKWIGMIADPGSSSGWPVCWHVEAGW